MSDTITYVKDRELLAESAFYLDGLYMYTVTVIMHSLDIRNSCQEWCRNWHTVYCLQSAPLRDCFCTCVHSDT